MLWRDVLGDLAGEAVSEQLYEKPPITESVIDLRFVEAVDVRVIEELDRDFADRYPRGERLSNIEMKVDQQLPDGSGPRVSTRSEFSGFKRTSESALDLVIFGPHSLCFHGWAHTLDGVIS